MYRLPSIRLICAPAICGTDVTAPTSMFSTMSRDVWQGCRGHQNGNPQNSRLLDTGGPPAVCFGIMSRQEVRVAADRRKVLLRAGRELFDRYGYKDVSIADITRSAGIATGSFYTYFPGKGEFYDSVLDELEREGIREIEERVALLSSPVGKLKALCRFAALGVRNRPILRGFLTGDRRFLHPGRRERSERPDSLRGHLANRVRGLIAEGARTGDVRAGLFRDPAAAVIALIEALFRHMGDESIDDLLHDVQRLLARGLGRRIRLRPTGRIVDDLRREEAGRGVRPRRR